MTPENSKAELEKRIAHTGIAIPDLLPEKGLSLMLDFYRDVRAIGCDVKENGDMLLFQWGTYDFDGRMFTCDLTRQFILAGLEDEDDDAAMSQLSFTFGFTPSPAFEALGDGNRWCDSPGKLARFQQFIESSAAYRTIKSQRPLKVTIDFSHV